MGPEHLPDAVLQVSRDTGMPAETRQGASRQCRAEERRTGKGVAPALGHRHKLTNGNARVQAQPGASSRRFNRKHLRAAPGRYLCPSRPSASE